MKKIYVLLAVAMLLCGCTQNENSATETVASESVTAGIVTEQTTSVTTVPEAETETTAETFSETILTVTLESKQEYLPNEEWLLSFMEYLQSGCTTEYYYLDQGNDFGKYDFMDDFTIESYTYSLLNDDGEYEVRLICSDSSCEMFPNGESLWYFGNGVFCPLEKAEQINSRYDDLDEPLKTAYYAAYDFSLYTRAFEFDKEWLENYTDIYVHGFYHAYNPYVTFSEDIDGETVLYDVTPEEFAAAVQKLYNINMTAEQAKSMIDDDGFMRRSCGHGMGWYYNRFVDYEETDSEVKVTIDYYGDELYFYPVIEVEYTFAKNDDGTITLQGAEKLFDRGYELASGSV